MGHVPGTKTKRHGERHLERCSHLVFPSDYPFLFGVRNYVVVGFISRRRDKRCELGSYFALPENYPQPGRDRGHVLTCSSIAFVKAQPMEQHDGLEHIRFSAAVWSDEHR
jgi:hypothetical protein